MALENNAICSICGKPYHLCNTCKDQLSFKPWRSVVDTINHYKIYMAIAEYTNKHINKATAKEMLEKCDISDYKTFTPDIVKAIDLIITDTPKKLDKGSNNTKKEVKPTQQKNNE